MVLSAVIKTAYFLMAASFVCTIVSCSEDNGEPFNAFPAIRVRVLNGCGFQGAASEMRSYLTGYNVDVISIGNADRFIYNKSIIVAKKDHPEDLERLKRYTNIERVAYALADDAVEAFQIIVGKDYLTLISSQHNLR